MKFLTVTLTLMTLGVSSTLAGGVLLPLATSETKVHRDALGNQATSYAYQDGHSSAVALHRIDNSKHLVEVPVPVEAPVVHEQVVAPVVYSQGGFAGPEPFHHQAHGYGHAVNQGPIGYGHSFPVGQHIGGPVGPAHGALPVGYSHPGGLIGRGEHLGPIGHHQRLGLGPVGYGAGAARIGYLQRINQLGGYAGGPIQGYSHGGVVGPIGRGFGGFPGGLNGFEGGPAGGFTHPHGVSTAFRRGPGPANFI